MSHPILTDEQLDRMRSFWLREGGDGDLVARDIVTMIDELQGRRLGEPLKLRGMEPLTEDEALLALADACSDVPSSTACKEFAALKRCGWEVQWTLGDDGFVIKAAVARKPEKG